MAAHLPGPAGDEEHTDRGARRHWFFVVRLVAVCILLWMYWLVAAFVESFLVSREILIVWQSVPSRLAAFPMWLVGVAGAALGLSLLAVMGRHYAFQGSWRSFCAWP